MTIWSPERLYAFFVRGAVYTGTSRESVEASTAFGWGATPISGYVREDVAEAESTALRRERDALRLVARRAGDVLAWVSDVLPGDARVLPGSECVAALNEAVDATLAAKRAG